MLCISMKEKKNDFPLYISNIHMCTISLIIYNKQFCNKFLPPLHFLYIVDDIKDRCVPRSFTIVIFGRQEKKKKKERERYVLFSVQQRFPYLEWILASRCVRFARECRHRGRYRSFLLLLSWAINIIVFVIVSSGKPRFCSGKIRREILLGGIESFRKQKQREKEKRKKKINEKANEHFLNPSSYTNFLRIV